jgi:uncharacterized membrane protein YdfJ with MMPL/SSD domain
VSGGLHPGNPGAPGSHAVGDQGTLTSLAIAAGTDYGIFIIGRYQEARQAGEERGTAFYTMYRGTAHVVLGSGLTIAGATFCLSFARLPYFQTLGVPCAVGMLVAVAVAHRRGPRARRLQQRTSPALASANCAVAAPNSPCA